MSKSQHAALSVNDYILLIGPPNSGKTTLFNWLTGYNRQTVNYPGSTATLSFGPIRLKSKTLSALSTYKVVDTPGIYSLFSPSPEGDLTGNILKDSLKSKELKGLILVLDATRLKRQLPLVFQLKSTGIPFILALSMYDIQKKSAEINIPALSKKLACPVCPIEGLLGGGVKDLLQKLQERFHKKDSSVTAPLVPLSADVLSGAGWSEHQQEEYLKKSKVIVDKVLMQKPKELIGQRTRLLDSFFLHPVWGFGFLSLILFVFFSGIFYLARPLMELIDKAFGYTSDYILSLGSGLMIVDFLAEAALPGFGAFLIFAPQVFILFMGIHLLEDSGYLARAVTLVDGPFSRIGLSGKSLFPFLSGFACAIPAVLSARAISSKRERWITIFVLPFMTCSARLPVYTLLIGFLFYGEASWKPGLVMAFVYFLSLLLGVFSAGLLNIVLKPDKKSSFLMELPLYRPPVLSNILSSSYARTGHFIRKAGPVIFVFSLMMWFVTSFPRHSDLPKSQQIQKSYAGRFGQFIEPVFEPMGGDWRVGVSLLSAFVAREVFVSVLTVVLKNTEPTQKIQSTSTAFLKSGDRGGMALSDTPSPDITPADSLAEGMPSKALEEVSPVESSMIQVLKGAKKANGSLLFSSPAVWALLVFFMFSLQCLSTTAIVYKETGSWRFSALQLIGLNALAYVGAVTVYTGLS